MFISGGLYPPLIYMNWKTVKLGEVAYYVQTKSRHKELTQEDYISTENMLPNKRGIIVASSTIPECYTKFQPCDILISNIRPYFQKIWFANRYGGCSNDVLCIRGDEKVIPVYLYYLLSQDIFFDYVMLGSKGTKMPRGDKNQIMQYEFPLPPLETQRRIAAILSSLDDKIENNNRINRNLEAQAQALFKSWFVDFEPFGGKMPEGWKEGSLYNYVDVIYGAPYQSALFNEHSEGLPLIRIRDLKTNSPQVSTTEILPNTEYIEAGDIVAGMDAEFSPYLWKGEKGLLNQRCCKFKANDSSISNYYVLFLVKPKLEYVQSYKTGTTVSHLGKADIDRFNVIIPPIEIVRKFSTQVDAMKELVVSNALESARLAALRDTLLPKLMKGEIAV